MPLCETCAKTMNFRFGAPMTVVGATVDPTAATPDPNASASYLPDPYAMGQAAGQAVEPVTPYGLGQQAGQATVKAAPSLDSAAQAVASTASTVKTALILAGIVGVGVVAYTFYNAQRTSARALDILEKNPGLLVKAGVLA